MYKEIAGALGASLIVGGLAYEATMYIMIYKYGDNKNKLEILKGVFLHPIRSRHEIDDLELRLK